MEALLRDIYDRFGRGDMAGVLELCTPDVVFHVPGHVPFAGQHTRESFGAFIGQVMQISEGTFREEIINVMSGTGFGSVLLRHTLTRAGQSLEYRSIHLWRIEHGRCAEWWEYPEDLHAFEAAWG